MTSRNGYLVIDWRELLYATSDLTVTDVAVGCALSSFMDRNGKCWPGVPAITAKAHCSVRQTRYSLRKLERLELILTEPGGGRHKPNRYGINPAAVAAFSSRNPATDDTNPAVAASEGVQKASKTPTASSLTSSKGKRGRRAGARRPKTVNTAGAHLKPDGSPDFDYLSEGIA